jgi:hypothetical protein
VTNSSVHNFSNILIPSDIVTILSYGPKFVFSAFPSQAQKTLTDSLRRRFDVKSRFRRGAEALTRAVCIAAQFKDAEHFPKPYYYLKAKNPSFNPNQNLIAVKGVLPFTATLKSSAENLLERLTRTKKKSTNLPEFNLKPSSLMNLVHFLRLPEVTVVLLDKNLGCAPVLTSDLIGALTEFFGTPSWERFSPQDGMVQLSNAAKKFLYLLENNRPRDVNRKRKFNPMINAVLPDLRTLKPNKIKPLFKAHKHRGPDDSIANKKFWRVITMAQNAFGQKFDAAVNKLLGALLDEVPAYLRDSSHAIHLLESLRFPSDAILSMGKLDFNDLYNSIDQNLMATAVRHFLEILFHELDTRTLDPGPWSIDLICDLLRIINENNYVEFNGNWYRQKIGIAMGRAFGVAGAVLTLAFVEKKMPSTLRDSFLFFKRYIDDIPFIFIGDKKTTINRLIAFYKKEANLKLNLEAYEVSLGGWDDKTCDVLDFTIRRVQDHLEVLPFEKPTNKHLYIPPISNHPDHCRAWIRAFLQRLTRNSTAEETFVSKAREFFQALRARGFRFKVLSPIFSNFNYQSERALFWTKYASRIKTLDARVADITRTESHSFYWVVPHDRTTRKVNWTRLANSLASDPSVSILNVIPTAVFHTAWSNLPTLAALIDASVQERLQGVSNPNPNPN